MNTDDSFDNARRAALDHYEFMDTITKVMMWIAGIAELGLGITMVWLTDFSDPVQRLIFVAAATIYMPLACFVFAISCHAERNSQRILKAIDLSDRSHSANA